jgi:cell division protein ZapA
VSNVTLTIGGRNYTVACAEGEEGHIVQLGATIDAKVAAMPGLATQSEGRTLLFAALLLADELEEARGGGPAPASTSGADGEALEALASRLEDLAARLEGSSWNA